MCISRGQVSDWRLLDRVVKEFTEHIGEPFLDLLVSRKHQQNATVSDLFSTLNDLWRKFQEPHLVAHQKGRRFEKFAAQFFGQVFKVVSTDLNTSNGELDLIIEITGQEPFWIEYGGDALVECKNWNSKTPLNEVATFAYKVARARVKLAFFVSMSGFTPNALQTLKNNSSDSAAPLVVPINGDNLRLALNGRQKLRRSLKTRYVK